MLKDYVEKYFLQGNYNCAEAVLHASNDYYQLGLSEQAMKLVSGFGGGMQTGNVCGTLLAAISVFSLRYVETKAHESEDIKPAVALLVQRFKEAMGGSILCCDIKPRLFQEGVRCLRTVEIACDVMEQVISEYDASLNRN